MSLANEDTPTGSVADLGAQPTGQLGVVKVGKKKKKKPAEEVLEMLSVVEAGGLSKMLDSEYLQDTFEKSVEDEKKHGDKNVARMYKQLAKLIKGEYSSNKDINGYDLIQLLKDNDDYDEFSDEFNVDDAIQEFITGI